MGCVFGGVEERINRGSDQGETSGDAWVRRSLAITRIGNLWGRFSLRSLASDVPRRGSCSSTCRGMVCLGDVDEVGSVCLSDIWRLSLEEELKVLVEVMAME